MIDADDFTPEAMAARAERDELAAWFAWYDIQIMQYQRCQRLGETFDQNVEELDAEAAVKQARIREIREMQTD